MAHTRIFEPEAAELRSFAWKGGRFDTGRRAFTEEVSGMIRTPHHVVLVTLGGGARNIEVSTDCGHVFSGPDRPGAVSFVPAHCERRARMYGVDAHWASIALPADQGHDSIAPFTNRNDDFLKGVVGEMARLIHADGSLDTAYCETMSDAARQYISLRYGRRAPVSRAWKLAPWQIRRIADYVEANIERQIAISDVAEELGLSTGHLHRAFRTTTGTTPLEFIHRARMKRAVAILAEERMPIAELALRVGFESPSRFARCFRRFTGINPSKFGRTAES